MKIVVCVKTVPDSAASLTVEDGLVNWGDAPLVLNPWDEYAVEAALQQKEAHGGSVTALSLSDENALVALRQALAMGADEAVHIVHSPAAALDTLGAARILAAAIQKMGAVDLAFFGRQAIDGEAGLVPAQTARLLGWPALTLASTVKMDNGRVQVERTLEEGRQTVSASLPAVVSLTKDFGEPRFPTFLNKRRAERTEVPAWSLADLGLEAPSPRLTRLGAALPPVRQAGCEMLTGDPAEIARQLVEKLLAEKVL